MNSVLCKEADAGTFAGYGGGLQALTGPALKLFHDLDRLFVHWARDCGATEYQFPATIPARELDRIGYFKSFPHHLTLPACLHDDLDNLSHFVDHHALDAEGAIDLPDCAPIKDVLTPAACYHFYVNLQNRPFDAPRYLTTRATCFRREARYVPLRRQSSFSMREIVCIGTQGEVMDFLDSRRRVVERFFARVRLPVAWQQATDPFFNPSSNPKYLAQRLDPVKTEMVYDGELAIGSVNFHRNYFGEAFRITRDNAEAFSGCVAFGLDRWLYAFQTHFGPDPADWPNLDRRDP